MMGSEHGKVVIQEETMVERLCGMLGGRYRWEEQRKKKMKVGINIKVAMISCIICDEM